METQFTFEPQENGDEAGVVVMLSSEFHVELFVRKEEGENYLILKKNAEDMVQVSFREKVGDLREKKLYMKIQSDKEKYRFYFGFS